MKYSKKVQNAWAFYDWANSVYSLTITSTIFPAYYTARTMTGNSDKVSFLGMDFINTALYSYALSFSFFVVILVAPFLSGIADYTGKKKSFMRFFAYLGSFSCGMLYFFEGDNLGLGITFFILASIGFSGSLVFYNAYLPEIAPPSLHDRLSARGFSFGYLGSIILLVFNLFMIMKPEIFGWEESSTLPARVSFLTVGIWWFGFSHVTFAHLPSNIYRKKEIKNPLLNGFKELKNVWKQLNHLPHLKIYLAAFLVFSTGIQTVMYLAPTFAKKEIGLPDDQLIISILIIQVVAIAGAILFSRISERKGNILTLTGMLIIWIGITSGAYFIQTNIHFFITAFFVGLVMGGVQSLSRSTYSKFLPETQDHASYFSFYDIAEKFSIVLGTALYGLTEEITGSMRNSLFSLMFFFIAGLILLIILRRKFNPEVGIS